MFADLAVHDTRLEECQGLYSNAWTGFHTWKQSSFQDRIQYMRKMRSLIVTHLDELIDIICADTGKVPVEAVTADLLTVVDYLKHVEKHGAQSVEAEESADPFGTLWA